MYDIETNVTATAQGRGRAAVDILRTGRPLTRGGQLTPSGRTFAERIAPIRRRAAGGR
jgi:hypothetical protein